MDSEDVFLANIIAHPEDDQPRFAYADWLEERDKERAEFIRRQCDNARASPDSPEDCQFTWDLLAAHRERFLGPLASILKDVHSVEMNAAQKVLGPLVSILKEDCPTDPDAVLGFRRGFVERVDLPLPVFVRHMHTLFAHSPVREVWLSRSFIDFVYDPELARAERISRYLKVHSRLSEPDLHALEAAVNFPPLVRVKKLDLHSVLLTDGGMNILARSPYLTGLMDLSVGGTNSGDEEMELLGASPLVENLVRLRLGDRLGSVGLAAIVKSDRLGPLQSLDLWGSRNLGPSGAAVLANAPRLTGLTQLNLNATSFGDAGASALAMSPYLRNLANLEMNSNTIGPAGISALATSSIFDGVKRLGLANNPFGVEGAAALAASPHLAGLTYLNLLGCSIGPSGTRSMAASPNFRCLESLDLGFNSIGSAGLIALSRSTDLINLKRLDLAANGVDDEGVMALADSPLLAGMEDLVLRNNPMGPKGIIALVSASGVGNLRRLGLVGCTLDAEAVRMLLDSPHLSRLETLDVQGCELSHDALQALRARFPEVWPFPFQDGEVKSH